MKHKTIYVAKCPGVRVRVRLHSIDGKTWSASSPRHAASEQLAYKQKIKDGKLQVQRLFDAYVPDDETWEPML